MEDMKLSQPTTQSISHSFADLLRPNKVHHSEDKPPHYWSLSEKVELCRLAAQGKTRKEIAKELGRTHQSVLSMARKLGVVSMGSTCQKIANYIIDNYPLFGGSALAKKLNIPFRRVQYIARENGVKYKPVDKYNPPLPRALTCYDMVKRVSLLDRDSPLSKDAVEDCVIIFYDKLGPSAPMMAMHLDELLEQVARHFKVDAQALTLTLLAKKFRHDHV
ncbi:MULTISPECIES: hypothetical protein [unclassified Salinivibrio]|jgi:hypothetical protein|uniref:hypothetical protein n=1 Tax=unclassified Salinivibrio TaxID=2636825 RepID=UPI000928076D|nr:MULTISPECIES: hypothetical protein [unclassified Salinivibrio]OOF17556.1 hypothetical protein BZJ17_16885 [Salinivibrio sp. IB574]SIO31404.1 hypothetical protein SAMN05444724_2619 [Salinivibrio sp. ES.052]SIO39210.1 hypothetical protein SAMN05444724_3214 [Salinivibrio sp. ES.052]SIO39278.1 hypothetical protein SAMN05444724_3219 [Salinivibrio sp. ES.052]SIO39350.1 hypothetical protein SAMN05444724_3224 [Salinivibrio sp. ES.052]